MGISLETAADLIPVYVWHHNIQKDEVGMAHFDIFQGRFSIHGDTDFVVVCQYLNQNIDIGFSVVYNHYPHFR